MKPLKLFSILCFMVLPFSGICQITASDSSGCAPLVNVTFTSPAGATSINWDFDDGAFSNLPSPVHTFISAGTYNVTFNGIVGGNPVSYSLTINVYGKPAASFTATPPLSGCVPLPVDFLDASTGGGGSAIVSREWAFGDGGVNAGNDPSPTYTYTIGGQFSVTLKVTDANGCDTSVTQLNLVKTSIPPNAVITTSPSPPAACIPPLMVSFTAGNSTSNSTTGGGLTYLWNFGGGNTSTALAPPAINYTNSGTFPVTLTVTDNNNCPATTNTNIVISAPTASFNAVDAVNDTVCPVVTFHNTSTGVNPFFTYGDNTSGTDTIHTYAPGTYQVTLTVQSGSCFDDTTITIVVEDVVAAFTSTPSYSCSWPVTIQYTNQSLNGYTYNWLFGDSTTSVVKNPAHTYIEEDTNQYTIYEDYYIYSTLLEVTSVHGCTALTTRNDSIWKPTARFMPDKGRGCAPLTVLFSDSSISNEPIVSRFWIFGDGGTSSGNNLTVTHTYTNPGVYYARLVIVNSAGCRDTSYIIPIYVGESSNPAFSVVPSTVCAGIPVQFTDLTAPGDSAQLWHYSADGGIMSHCYNVPDPVWSYYATTGPQSITLTTVYNGCEGSTTVPNAINVLGPLAHFYPEGNCATPFTYIMKSDIQDADHWTWDFGDGTVLQNSVNPQPSHTYTQTGDYTVTLTAYNNTTGCAPYVETAIVNVRNISASFTTDTLVCAGDSSLFIGGASIDVHSDCYTGYTWYWGDDKPPFVTSNPQAYHEYTNGGAYTVKLVVTDINGCVDSVKQVVKAYEIHAGFVADKLYGCLPFSVSFNDTSASDTTITQWQWNFGDGGTSGIADPLHVFNQTGVNYWNVVLTITNALGCVSQQSVIIRPSIPDADFFTLTDANICVGETVSFSAVSSIVTYSWNFGNSTTSILANPVATYPAAGNYTVTLTVTDSIGCKSTEDTVISVQNYPIAAFVSSADTLLNKCYPLLINFSDVSNVNVFGSRDWDLGNGSITIGDSTVGTIYNAPGVYVVTLIETTTNGCSDTVSKSITIEGPVGNFNIVPNQICRGGSITFSIKDTADVLGYSWDFGDGTTAPGTSPITHTFNINPISGQTMVSLVMWSPDSACTATQSNPVFIAPVIADFSITSTDSVFCLNEPLVLSNQSVGATASNWNFGDGTSYSGTIPPPHTFPAPGNYSITLLISNSLNGCSDSITRNISILDIPDAVAVGGDTCQGGFVQLQSSGGISYSWSPLAGLSDGSISNPIATPLVSTDYTVIVTDVNGCTDDAIAPVIIYEPPVEVHFDTLMIIGDSIQLFTNLGSGYSYSWTPPAGLSCTGCPDPWAHPLVSTTYYVTIEDSAGCYSITSTYEFIIKPLTTVDVPTAFTPDGDGINDIIYVDGLGIKRLIEFKIYNRWGQLLFETTDINEGWDGFYKGSLQNVETYVYHASVETWLNGEILTKKGSFNLIR